MIDMHARLAQAPGFIAALDQSGGSTPGALRLYGVPDAAYGDDEAAMFRLMHEMRVRIISAPAFTGDKVFAAILFERTMDGEAGGRPVPEFLRARGAVPLLKVDAGLEAEADGVCLMKPMPRLDGLLERAVRLGVAGTKMRSTIRLASPAGIDAVAAQQFEVAARIADQGLMPIIEPEVLIKSPEKAAAEGLLRDALLRRLDTLPAGRRVMLKLTLPEESGFYGALVDHPAVARVVALSGGYACADACARLARNRGIVASFSRALVEDLRHDMDDADFDRTLAAAIDTIFLASTQKTQA